MRELFVVVLSSGLFLVDCVALRRRGQSLSKQRTGESVVIFKEALVRTVSSPESRRVTILVGVDVNMGKPNGEVGKMICVAVYGSSRKDVEETARLEEHFGALTTSGT